MKILGHAYIATHAVDGNNQLLIIGSLLPEMLPYIPNDIFDYKELHEGGRKLLEYLEAHYPEKQDLALGLLSHGVELGADKFSRASEEFVAPKRESLLKKISQAEGVSSKIAESRLHNYVGLGIDWLLVQGEPELIRNVQETLKEIDTEEISHLLAEAFGKNEAKIRVMVKTLFESIYHWEDLTSVEGLARIWARQAAGLTEGDRVDVPQVSEIIKECGDLLEGEWRSFLESTNMKVREALQAFSLDKERDYSRGKLERNK